MAGALGGYRVRVAATLAAAALSSACGNAENDTPAWPKQVTLTAADLGTSSEAVRLANGELVADGGDIALSFGVQLSLRSPTARPEMLCLQGTFATLADVTTDTSCPADTPPRWESVVFLSAAIAHESADSDVIGLGALARSEAGATYRLRVIGDAVRLNAEGFLGTASATFEYEPVP